MTFVLILPLYHISLSLVALCCNVYNSYSSLLGEDEGLKANYLTNRAELKLTRHFTFSFAVMFLDE